MRPNSAPDDERFVEHAAAREILDQADDRLVDLRAKCDMPGLQAAVGVSGAGAAVAVLESLNEPYALLRQSPRGQALLAEVFGRRVVEPVQRADAKQEAFLTAISTPTSRPATGDAGRLPR